MRIDSGHLLGNGRYERLQSINRHGPRHNCQHLGSRIWQHPRKDALPVMLLHVLWEPQKCLSAPHKKTIINPQAGECESGARRLQRTRHEKLHEVSQNVTHITVGCL